MAVIKKKKLKIPFKELVGALVDLEYHHGHGFILEALKKGISKKDITPALLHAVQSEKERRHRETAEANNQAKEKGKSPFWYVIENDREYDPRLNPEYAQRIYDSPSTSNKLKEEIRPYLRIVPVPRTDISNAQAGQTSKSIAKSPESMPESEKSGVPLLVVRDGKRYKIFGHSIRTVLHWMGKEDWSFSEAKTVMDKLKIDLSKEAISVGLSEGTNPKRSDPAPLTKPQRKELYSMLK